MSVSKSPRQAARIGDAAVQAKTGKTWPEWFALLDRAGAKTMSHKEIVAWLEANDGPGPWWQQMVTVAYEQERGLRKKHETTAGYQISRSRTMAVPVESLYQAFKDKRRRQRWLADPDFTIRTATENKSLRITWSDGTTNVEVLFTSRAATKSQVSVQHNRLADEAAAEKMKRYWGEQLDRLQAYLEGKD